MRYPRSSNAPAWKWELGHLDAAGSIELAPGRSRPASVDGQRRAGAVIDLWRSRAHRLAGNKGLALAYLDFARAARLALSNPGFHYGTRS